MNVNEPTNLTPEDDKHYRKLFDTAFELAAEYELGEILIALANYAECEAEDEEICTGHAIIANHAARELRNLADSLASLEDDMFPQEEHITEAELEEARKKVQARADELERQANDQDPS